MTPSSAPEPLRSPTRWIAAGLVVLGLGVAMLAGSPSPAAAQAGATTSTLPTDNRQLGDIIPEPFTGVEPQDPGDPGGWLQVSLFFILVGVILAMVGGVWLISRRARQRREAAGLDPVSVARRQGRGVRTARLGDGTAGSAGPAGSAGGRSEGPAQDA